MQGGVQNRGVADRDDHQSAASHMASRALRAPRTRRFAMRGIVAAALTGLALSGLVMVPGVARAEAPLETPGADSITFNRSEGRIGKAVLNDSGKDRTTVVADNSYFGIVSGMTTYNSADPNQRSVPYRSGYAQDWLDADTATSGDYWSYVTRGVAWDYHMAAYYRYPYYGEYTPDAISTSTTSALGYKPNNPGTVPLNSTFLIGAVRHNNFPIYSQIHWVHSSFDIRIGDLEESFPFDQQETDNDTDTTAVRRKGGPYEWVSRASAPRTCPSTAPYYALARSDRNWHCFKKVGVGKGRYDIYTDQPQYYPGSAGKPDQTPDSDDVLTITKTTSDHRQRDPLPTRPLRIRAQRGRQLPCHPARGLDPGLHLHDEGKPGVLRLPLRLLQPGALRARRESGHRGLRAGRRRDPRVWLYDTGRRRLDRHPRQAADHKRSGRRLRRVELLRG